MVFITGHELIGHSSSFAHTGSFANLHTGMHTGTHLAMTTQKHAVVH